jgi:hypothetical protein
MEDLREGTCDEICQQCLVSKPWPASGSRAIVKPSWASIDASASLESMRRVSLERGSQMGIPVTTSCE